MRRHLPAFGIVVVMALGGAVGCAGSLPPVTLEGPRSDIAALVGKWSGEYAAAGVRGRRGSIMFTLAEGEDQAHGDVLMTPVGSQHQYLGSPNFPLGENQFPAPAESLTIRFVRVDGRYVSGRMDRYWDPDRNCWANTIFFGELAEHTIAGTFRTTFSAPELDVDGWWRAQRVR